MVHFEEKHKFEGSFPVEFMVKTCFEEGKKPHFEKVFFSKSFSLSNGAGSISRISTSF